MKPVRFFLHAAAIFSAIAHAAENFHFADVVVYGDSPSALSAAIELAESSHDVLLVCPVAHVGGMMVEGLGHQDIDGRSGSGEPIGGLTAEFYQRIARAYSPNATTPRYSFEAKVAQRVIDGWLEEKNVRQLRNARLSEAPGSVAKADGRIASLKMEDGSLIAGKVFIDGTVEGDLMAAAGVTWTWGREGNAAYGENVGGILNPTSKDQYKVSVDPYVVPGDPSSGVITGIQDEEVGVHGAGDKAAMGFCLRLPLTKNPANKIPVTAPPGYDPADYEIYRRYLAAGGKNDWLDGPGSVNASTTTKLFDLGSWHDLSGNFYGRNHAYPVAGYAGREAIYREHKEYTQGLIHFLSTDPSVPRAIRDEWSRWGLPADEFTDNGGWPRRLYVRCARRMISDYVITEADVRRHPVGSVTPRPPVSDPIGICWWPVDLHNARTVIRDGKAYNEGAYFDLTNYKPFGIPYRSIVPKRADCLNILVPSALSSSYAGYGAVRLEWTFMVLGQSAATAAALALDKDLAVQDIPYGELATLLLARGQKLAPADENDGIIADNSDPAGVAITGSWTSSTNFPGHVGPDYLHDGNAGKGTKTVRFTPEIPEAGDHAVYTRWNSDAVRATNAPIEIVHAGGTANLTVNQRANGNAWNLLGVFPFEAGSSGSVTFRNDQTDGYVIVDAVRFVPTSKPVQVTLAAKRGTAVEGGLPAIVTLHRTGSSETSLPVPLTYGGSATPDTDLPSLPAAVTIPAGKTSVDLEIPALPDDFPEGEETLIVSTGSSEVTLRLLDPPYQRWQARHFPQGGAMGRNDDPDRDGLPNLLEFVLARDPREPNAAPPAGIQVLQPNGGPTMDFGYWKLLDTGTTRTVVETSTDMKTWTETTAPREVIGYDAPTGRIHVRHRFPVTEYPGKLFVRIEAISP